MILLLSQIAVTISLFAILVLWAIGQFKQRRTKTWDDLVGQLRVNEWGFEEISERYLYKSGITATPEDIWPRIEGAKGLWAMYQNASILLKLADFAAQNSDSTNEALIAALRADALQIRLSVISALVKYAFSRSTVGASVNAHRAATMYSEMLFHMTTLFQEHSAQLFPRYLQAM
jgi:hypothetical protein